MELTLHIGLPKTATTTLQKHVFPQIPFYQGKFSTFRKHPSHSWMVAESAFAAWWDNNASWQDEVRDWLDALDWAAQPRQFFSDERLLRWPVSGSLGSASRILDDEWADFTRTRPHPIVLFLDAIRKSSADGLRLRLIVTLRAQTEFLGSRYVQSARSMKRPSQEDFEEKVLLLLKHEDPFCDWFSLVEELRTILDPLDVLVLLHEDGLDKNIRSIYEFMMLACDPSATHNQRENGRGLGNRSWRFSSPRALDRLTRAFLIQTDRVVPDSWRTLRSFFFRILVFRRRFRFTRRELSLKISDELAERVREHYADSNGRLAHLLGRDLTELGY
jgi:hypothetical protein